MFPMDLRTTAAKQRRAEMDHRTFFPLLPGHAGKNLWHMEFFSNGRELDLSFESSLFSGLSTTYLSTHLTFLYVKVLHKTILCDFAMFVVIGEGTFLIITIPYCQIFTLNMAH